MSERNANRQDTFTFVANLRGDFDAWSNSDDAPASITPLGADYNDNDGGWYERFRVTAESKEAAEALLEKWIEKSNVVELYRRGIEFD